MLERETQRGADGDQVIAGIGDSRAVFGGPGLRRGRRDPDSLSYGEALDF